MISEKKFLLDSSSAFISFNQTDLESISIYKLRKIIEELRKVPEPSGKWILVSDTGRIYIEKPEELLLVLMPHHPLLKSLKSI